MPYIYQWIYQWMQKLFLTSQHPLEICITSLKCNIPIDCNTLLKVMHSDLQRDNDKNMNSKYPKIAPLQTIHQSI